MPFIVYIVRTSGNTLYVGQTNDLQKRLLQHAEKKVSGAKYLRLYKDFELVHQETFSTRSEAMKREAEIKSWSKAQKESLITDKV